MNKQRMELVNLTSADGKFYKQVQVLGGGSNNDLPMIVKHEGKLYYRRSVDYIEAIHYNTDRVMEEQKAKTAEAKNKSTLEPETIILLDFIKPHLESCLEGTPPNGHNINSGFPREIKNVIPYKIWDGIHTALKLISKNKDVCRVWNFEFFDTYKLSLSYDDAGYCWNLLNVFTSIDKYLKDQKGLQVRIVELEAERDRYREALEKIANQSDEMMSKEDAGVYCRSIAEQALNQKEGKCK